MQVEGDSVDGVIDAGAGVELDREVAHLEQGSTHLACSKSSSSISMPLAAR